MRKYYFKFINILALSAMLVLLSAGPIFADGGPHEEVSKVGGYEVKLVFVAGNAQIGSNELKAVIIDALGKPVGNATVKVVAELFSEKSGDERTGMDMGKTTTAGTEQNTQTPIRVAEAEMMPGEMDGEYEGDLILEEAGHWMIQIEFLILSRQRVAEFPIEVNGKPNSLGILGAFIGINTAIIIVAGATRKKHSNKLLLEENK